MIPEANIGTLGHVDHGKSTLVQAITGKWPALHSEELKRGITIKLGYADATIYKCPKCGKLLSTNKCLDCGGPAEPQRTVSFVDAPGHETLMATVLAGAALMDGVLLVIAANEKCPQPQTAEHLMVLDTVGIKNIIIVQNKIDLVTHDQALENYKQIKAFVNGSVAENAPIIPVSAQQGAGIDALLAAIQENIITPARDASKPARMFIVRSFDINKPGTPISKIKGGVLGGALVQGTLKVGDMIMIAPGIQVKDKWQPLKTKVVGLQKAGRDINEAGPGGLLGVMTALDPSLTKADNLAGSMAGVELPATRLSLSLETRMLERTIDAAKIDPIKPGEMLMLNVGTSRTVGVVKAIKKGITEIELKLPVVCDVGAQAVLSRRVNDRWRLIGVGTVK
ncbi:MAG: translation initiation factor IF-2 subunit gamma [Candidatus Aenigmatarchaeota archaeon]|nr:translation initiation factor IF-2 subunit gamma [Candidatus Aenigmarchaeota archaeon]